MYRVIGIDGQQYGPITAEQVRRWLTENRVNSQTLAQLEGTQDWKPLSSFAEFATDLKAGIDFVRVFQRDLQVGIFHLLGRLYDGLHREGADLAAVFIQLRAEVFLRFVVLARRHDNGIFHRTHHNLRVNSLFTAHAFDDVVELASHKKSKFQTFKVSMVQRRAVLKTLKP